MNGDSRRPWEFWLLDSIFSAFLPGFNLILLIGNIREILLTIGVIMQARDEKISQKFYTNFVINQNIPNIAEDPIPEPVEGFDPITGAYYDAESKTWCDPELVPDHIHKKFGNFRIK